MTISIDKLTALQLDVLKEIGNIGAGNAATALAQLLKKKVNMAVPKVQILDFNKLTDVLGGAENIVVGILINISGQINGYIMFILEEKNAYALLNLIVGGTYTKETILNEMDISALTEIGNILAGSFLSALSSLTKLRIFPSIPGLTFDMAGAILSVPAIEFGKVCDTVLFIETEFVENNDTIIGNFFLIPDIESYDTLLKALGVII